ncbi:MAG: hypothetical protein QOE36_3622 [Gaiellaceae bacterium]|nr:hypothetical protein [Gaiellaceae bacterium]
MNELRAVPYEPARRDDVWRLMEDVWGEYVSQEHFDWWFEHNPAGPRLITLVDDEGGRLVGTLGMSFARALVAGRELVASVTVHGATDAAFRGRGIFQLLNRVNEDESRELGAHFLLAFSSANSRPIFTGPLGWSEIAAPRYWLCPLRPLSALRSLRGRPPRGGLCSRPGPNVVDSFDAAAERTWRDAAPALRSHFARDLEYLRWRYTESPRGYRILRVGRSYAVVGHTIHHGLSAGYLADLVAPPDAGAEVRLLLRRCLHEVEADVFMTLPPRPPAHRRALLSLGFLPTPQTIRVLAKTVEPGLELPARTRDWHFMLGDTDFF